jgi:hypothetical protein
MRALALVLLLTSPALANDATHVDFPYHGLAVDLSVALSLPAADNTYTRFADPTARIGINVGWELAVHQYFLIEPELELDIIPVNTDDATFNDNNVHFNPAFNRVRFLIGARLAARIKKVEPFLRLGFGVDWIGGSVVPPIGNTRDFSSAGFAFKPGLGVQGEVYKHVVIGGEIAFPVASHNFGNVDQCGGNVVSCFNGLQGNVSFTAFDVEIAIYAGFRY